MIKAIFWIIVFFFFISVLFLGIRFIFQTLMNLANPSNSKNSKPEIKKEELTYSANNSIEFDHQIQFFDPTLNKITTLCGHIEKCYEEHQQQWIKFRTLEKSMPKIIKVNNINQVENLITKEKLLTEQPIQQYFERFL